MKILLSLDFPPETGGIQRYLYDRVAHTYGPEDAVIVGGEGRDRDIVAPAGLPCRVKRVANVFSGLDKKWSLVNLFLWLAVKYPSGKNTVFECGNIYAAVAPWLLSWFRPVRYRVFTYGGELLCLTGRSVKAALFRNILRRADGISALGAYTAGILRAAGVTREITIEPPRIDLPEGAVLPERKAAPDGRTACLLSIGRLVPHKGHRVLLAAVSLLPQDCNWSLVIAGSGPEERSLRTIIAENKLLHRVTIATGLDDTALAALYENADLFILPSLASANAAEGFGIVLLEAAAHGIPIIASRVGGVTEVLDDGRCGMLVAPGDTAALSSAIASLWQDFGRRDSLRKNAFDRVRERYAW